MKEVTASPVTVMQPEVTFKTELGLDDLVITQIVQAEARLTKEIQAVRATLPKLREANAQAAKQRAALLEKVRPNAAVEKALQVLKACRFDVDLKDTQVKVTARMLEDGQVAVTTLIPFRYNTDFCKTEKRKPSAQEKAAFRVEELTAQALHEAEAAIGRLEREFQNWSSEAKKRQLRANLVAQVIKGNDQVKALAMAASEAAGQKLLLN